jgi:2-methyl-3-hydroxypyridine 5-carboxylic acid dioxygenase
MRRRHAEIAGGGFAGLTAAIALCQRGWTARVHEADSEFRAYGAGIFIWENGLRVLDALGVLDDVLAGAHEAPLSESRNHANKQMSADRFGPQRGSRMVTMTRQHLFAPLLAAAERAGVDLVAGSGIAAAKLDGTLVTAGGRALPADIAIGADGVRSAVRNSLGLPVTRAQFEHAVIRLLVSRSPDDAGGDGADHIINFWSPRYRVLYVPCSPTELYILLSARRDDRDALSLPVRKDIWRNAFPCLASVVDRIDSQGRFDIYETTKLQTWSKDRVAIVGDAAHAMPPTLGQGAGCAMMNALSLAVHVAEDNEIEPALRRWEQMERPLTEHTQDISNTFAATRAGSSGQSKWTDEAMRTARHVPTGTGGRSQKTMPP